MSGESRELKSAFHTNQILNEGLILVRQDLCDWINEVYKNPVIQSESFLDDLGSGIMLCELVQRLEIAIGKDNLPKWWRSPTPEPARKKMNTFTKRENISKFLEWCRKCGFENTILFETRGLVNKDEEKNVVLTLLRLAEMLSYLEGIPLPEFAKYYRQLKLAEAQRGRTNSVFGGLEICGLQNNISTDSDSGIDSPRNRMTESLYEVSESGSNKDDDTSIIAADATSTITITNSRQSTPDKMQKSCILIGAEETVKFLDKVDGSNRRKSPMESKIQKKNSGSSSNKLRERSNSLNTLSLTDVKIKEAASRCCCENKFRIEKMTMQEGKYKFGSHIRFLRIFNGTIVIRVGGGWETLNEYLTKVDPCQKAQLKNKAMIQSAMEKSISKSPNSESTFIKKVTREY